MLPVAITVVHKVIKRGWLRRSAQKKNARPAVIDGQPRVTNKWFAS